MVPNGNKQLWGAQLVRSRVEVFHVVHGEVDQLHDLTGGIEHHGWFSEEHLKQQVFEDQGELLDVLLVGLGHGEEAHSVEDQLQVLVQHLLGVIEVLNFHNGIGNVAGVDLELVQVLESGGLQQKLDPRSVLFHLLALLSQEFEQTCTVDGSLLSLAELVRLVLSIRLFLGKVGHVDLSMLKNRPKEVSVLQSHLHCHLHQRVCHLHLKRVVSAIRIVVLLDLQHFPRHLYSFLAIFYSFLLVRVDVHEQVLVHPELSQDVEVLVRCLLLLLSLFIH